MIYNVQHSPIAKVFLSNFSWPFGRGCRSVCNPKEAVVIETKNVPILARIMHANDLTCKEFLDIKQFVVLVYANT